MHVRFFLPKSTLRFLIFLFLKLFMVSFHLVINKNAFETKNIISMKYVKIT